jgi:hypothetical protein
MVLAGCTVATRPAALHSPLPRVTVTVTVTATNTVIRYRHHRHPRPLASPSPSVPAVSFGCKVLRTGTGEEFNVATVGGSSYSGTVYVSFYDYAGSGHVFPGTTVNGATSVGAWYPLPAADIGASAEPSGCTASAG